MPAAEANGLGRQWQAGQYSFSDERGGFLIRSVSGTGTRSDPVILGEEMETADPVILTIRARQPTANFTEGILYLRIVALNGSGHPWVDFMFELQSIMNQPSVFGDGLSFDQTHTPSDFISSDSFARYDRQLEPFDRLRFLEGHVDTHRQASFDFLITDFNPKSIFYLLQDPGIPAS
ncbi:hypothetical protein FJW06_08085 [Mesorhizobium sp. B4-1-3]|uniref:hypothetical protein n=1 Tax=Mesorhizobium sp. B4-1-3 TaxID=2589889 RepID=UPI00112D002F|nr:hypothetical protein [Mesorhizobium sp. B4-1-3]TPI15354.1 hypothetical protein FJW06_08085 [Mesorhizobium sp. B4-1-3]